MLKKLGMALSIIFLSSASFNAISKEPLYISSAIHKAFITVSEEGTDESVWLKPIKNNDLLWDINVDHPFAFIIRDDVNHLNLFQGFVTNL